ncbi:MAG: hypothetical protein ACRDNW_01040 [Trebonia sp.]
MIWVTWRQQRAQAIGMLVLLAIIGIYALVLGLAMRSSFNSADLGTCLARNGGAGCAVTINSFIKKFSGPLSLPVSILVFVIPGYLGAVVGAPLLGQELERGTWRLAWSQTLPRRRWLAVKLALITGVLVVFAVAVTLLLTWSRSPLDRVGTRLQPQPFNFEGIVLPCALLCGFGLALLAGLLLRNTIGAMIAGYIAWEIPFVMSLLLLAGPIHIFAASKTIQCHGNACATASVGSSPPVTGQLGDQVLGIVHSGSHLTVNYLPAGAFWPLQFVIGGMYLAIAAAAIGATLWLLRRRTT